MSKLLELEARIERLEQALIAMYDRKESKDLFRQIDVELYDNNISIDYCESMADRIARQGNR